MSVDIHLFDLRIPVYDLKFLIQGIVSQIFNLDLSFYFMSKNGYIPVDLMGISQVYFIIFVPLDSP